jgi:protein SCO1/2
MSRKTILLVLIFLVTPLGLWNAYQLFSHKANYPELQGVLWPEPKPLAEFALIDQRKQPFNLERLKGKWTFVFFGYTYCPDICPTAMATLKTVFEHLQPKPEVMSETQVVFVSVDPPRDTPEQLSDYLKYFNEEFIGATGTADEIEEFARQMGAGYLQQPATTEGGYQISHTGTFFLIDPQARFYARFSQPHIPKTIVSQYLKIRSIW